MSSQAPTSTRRHGAVLEAAILEAAWEQLVAEGYSHFSCDTVAARAQTGKSVLYRRWGNREKLLRAAIRHHGETQRPLAVPDTGAIRSDLIAFLAEANEHRVDEMLTLSGVFAGKHTRADGLTLDDVRRDLIGDRPTGLQTIVNRAIARGEIDGDKVTPRVITLPFDLFRLEVIGTMRRVPDHVCRQIIDDIFLPIVTPT